jgi:transposase
MGKPYPLAFRKRVVAAVESGGLSCNQAAKQFGIGISTAIGWVNRLRKTGSLAPGQMGGHKPKAISGEHRVWLLQRTKNGDFTLRGLVAELGEHGLKVDYRSVWEFVHAEKLLGKLRISPNLKSSCFSQSGHHPPALVQIEQVIQVWGSRG